MKTWSEWMSWWGCLKIRASRAPNTILKWCKNRDPRCTKTLLHQGRSCFTNWTQIMIQAQTIWYKLTIAGAVPLEKCTKTQTCLFKEDLVSQRTNLRNSWFQSQHRLHHPSQLRSKRLLQPSSPLSLQCPLLKSWRSQSLNPLSLKRWRQNAQPGKS